MRLKNRIGKLANVNEWSYQRFSQFLGVTELTDKNFEKKIKIIIDAVNKKKLTDIDEIAQKAQCSFEECVLKIRYCENKRLIENKYLDTVNHTITDISVDDEKLLTHYAPYLYHSHLQIDEIVNRLPYTSRENYEKVKEQVYQDIEYLYDRNLINGIILNKVDKKIIYYSLEKKKKEIDYISLNCPNCGALNDCLRHSKTRCSYCHTIVEDKKRSKG